MRIPFLRRRPKAVVVAVALVLLVAGPVAAQVAGEWSQFQGGSGHPGWLAEAPAPPYELAWEFESEPGGDRNQFGLSAPIVAGGLAIATGPEAVVAADLATGGEAWSVERTFGPSTPPAVADVGGDPILLFTEGWDDGPPDPQTATTSSPTASPSPSGEEDEVLDSRLVAVEFGGSKRLWSVDLPEVSRTGVTVDGEVAYVGTNDGAVTAVDVATGEVGWTGDAGGFLQTPLSVGDGVVVAPVLGTVDDPFRLVALDVADGTEAWRYDAPGFLSAATIEDGLVFATYPTLALSHLVALDASDGAVAWDAALYASAAPFAPALSETGVVALDLSGHVFAVDRDGERLWDHAANAFVARTNPVVLGDAVVVGFADGDLATFDATSGDMTWRGSIGPNPVRSLAASSDTLVAVRAGAAPALVGLRTDPDGTSIAIDSPTVPRPLSMAGTWVIAAIPLTVILLLLGRWLATRADTFAFDEGEDAGDLEDPDDEDDEDDGSDEGNEGDEDEGDSR